MSKIAIREAAVEDAPFLARGILESDRGHVGVGTWDFAVPMPDADRLDVLQILATASDRTYVHWSRFLVAELEGTVVGCVSSYVPDEFLDDVFMEVFLSVMGPRGWDKERLTMAAERGFLAPYRQRYGKGLLITHPPMGLLVRYHPASPSFKHDRLIARSS